MGGAWVEEVWSAVVLAEEGKFGKSAVDLMPWKKMTVENVQHNLIQEQLMYIHVALHTHLGYMKNSGI